MTSTNYNDTAVSSNSTYYYKVVANNLVGASDYVVLEVRTPGPPNRLLHLIAINGGPNVTLILGYS